MSDKRGNDIESGIGKLCLALEQDRRTPQGRFRSPTEFREHYFRHDDASATDRIFRHLPNEVRGSVLFAWGLRGPKTAVRDGDDKVRGVVHDALVAGDLDDALFEDGLGPELVLRWTAPPDWWSFWRGGKLTRHAMRKALEVAVDLGLVDAKWLLASLELRADARRGTDVLAAGLSKDDLAAWIRAVHESGDASAKGLVAALGWQKIADKTPEEALLGVLDTLAVKLGLAKATAEPSLHERAAPAGPPVSARPAAPVPAPVAAPVDDASRPDTISLAPGDVIEVRDSTDVFIMVDDEKEEEVVLTPKDRGDSRRAPPPTEPPRKSNGPPAREEKPRPARG